MKRLLYVGTSAANALFMLLVSMYLLNLPVVQEDEKALVAQTSGLKAKYLGAEPKPDADAFLFVNLSYENALIPSESALEFMAFEEDFGDEFEEEGFEDDAEEWLTEEDLNGGSELDFPYGNQIITDRSVLAHFFQILNQQPTIHKYVLCDVIFEHPSPHDAALAAELEKLPNVLLPIWEDGAGSIQQPLFDAQAGLATYTAVDDAFVKYNLQPDSIKSMPLLMYEQLHGKELRKGDGFFHQMDGKPVFNNFILNFRISTEDVLSEEGVYHNNYWKSLSTVLTMNSEEEIRALCKDKIIVLGDFERSDNDYHQTVFGEMAGPLILLNVYLALVAGDNGIHPALYLILFVGFFIISLQLFHPTKWFDVLLEKANARIERFQEQIEHQSGFKGVVINLIADQVDLLERLSGTVVAMLTYLTLFGLVSISAFLLLNNHINIFYLSLYVVLFERVIGYVNRFRAKGKEAED